jgi:hypothetical protein
VGVVWCVNTLSQLFIDSMIGYSVHPSENCTWRSH